MIPQYRWLLVVLPLSVVLAFQFPAALSQTRQFKRNRVDGAEMVLLPGGTFKMGGSREDNEKPAHNQSVKGFWMYTKEVTNGQFRKFVQAKPFWSLQPIDRRFYDDRYLNHWQHTYSEAPAAENYPVLWVSWHAAKAYAEWAGGRLPTEAEWEYAAKGGRNLEYPTSTGQINNGLANYEYLKTRSTKEVGSYPANPFGLHDMAGNAWEWCSSLYQPYPYVANDGRENPNASGTRVLRGGSCYDGLATSCRSSNRNRDDPKSCSNMFGFRVVIPSAGG